LSGIYVEHIIVHERYLLGLLNLWILYNELFVIRYAMKLSGFIIKLFIIKRPKSAKDSDVSLFFLHQLYVY